MVRVDIPAGNAATHPGQGEQGLTMPVTAEQASAILLDVQAGDSLDHAVKKHGVASATFYRAMDADPELAGSYARAREIRHDRMAEDTLRICDDPEIPSDQKRVMVDTRKWLLSKLAQGKYGEKLQLGGDKANPIVIQAAQGDERL